MATTGRVRIWNDDEGWGVIDSTDTPGGCWAHYSALAVDGFRSLAPGQDVVLEWEAARQDGHDFRALRAWPLGRDPVAFPTPRSGPSGAYRSELTITFADGTTRTTDGSGAVAEDREEGA